MEVFLLGNRAEVPLDEGHGRPLVSGPGGEQPAPLGGSRGHDHAVVEHDARLYEQKHEQKQHRQGESGLHGSLAILPTAAATRAAATRRGRAESHDGRRPRQGAP